jgi:hypothetical protein
MIIKNMVKRLVIIGDDEVQPNTVEITARLVAWSAHKEFLLPSLARP